MRVTICELPHEPGALAHAWKRLCAHTSEQRSELVLLPEFAMAEPVWEREAFDEATWTAAEATTDAWLARMHELQADHVVGTRPVRSDGRRFNQGYQWSAARGAEALRSKHFFPEEPGGWEARWFAQGDASFPVYQSGACTFGLNICTEVWAVETYAEYAERGVELILSPRATALATTAKWLAAGVVCAVRAGAFSVSSNRVDESGTYGGGGWVVNPDGVVLATTSHVAPFATVDIDLTLAAIAKESYPRYVFSARRG